METRPEKEQNSRACDLSLRCNKPSHEIEVQNSRKRPGKLQTLKKAARKPLSLVVRCPEFSWSSEYRELLRSGADPSRSQPGKCAQQRRSPAGLSSVRDDTQLPLRRMMPAMIAGISAVTGIMVVRA